MCQSNHVEFVFETRRCQKLCGKVFKFHRFFVIEVVKQVRLHWISIDHHWTSIQEPRSMELEGGAHELVTTPWANRSMFIVLGICSLDFLR